MNFDQLLDELHIDKASVRSRFSNMDNILERFLLKFPQDQCIRVMEQSLSENQREEFERASHTLKGLAANLGLDELSHRAAQCVAHVRTDAFDTTKAKELYLHTLEEYNRVLRVINTYHSLQ